MKKILAPRTGGSDLPRLPLIPTLLALAASSTVVSSAVEVTFRYYRFTSATNKAGDNTQMSEFLFYNRGTKLDLSGVTVTGGVTNAPAAGEGVTKLIDGNLATKWFDAGKVPVVFDFQTPTTIDSYRFATANDFLDRTPQTWLLQGSNDNVNYVNIDNRTGTVAAPTSLFTYTPIITIPGGSPLPTPVFDTTFTQIGTSGIYDAKPAIVLNGATTTLGWTVGNTPTDITLTPGSPGLATPGSSVITPPSNALTNYTLSATNASGTTGLTQKIKAVPGGSATGQYVRFIANTLRGNGNLVQVAEIEFFNGPTKLTVASVSNPGGYPGNSINEAAPKAIDGDFNTKWLNHNNAPLVFDLGSSQTFDGYQLTTGNDAPDRDPVRWTIETSTDGITWKLVDAVVDYTPPNQRKTKSGILPISGSTLEWTASTDATWNTTTSNWVSPTAVPASYSDNVAVILGESTINRDINLESPVAPSFVSINNTTTPYTLSGAPITGPGGIMKLGSGEATLAGANTFNGAVYAFGGKLIVSDANGLGVREAPHRLEIANGGELDIMTDVTTQRRMHIGSNGGTLKVEDGVTFTKIGPVDFWGPLVKTGAGTFRIDGYNGSSSPAASDLTINEGVVDFTAAQGGYFNSRPFGGRNATNDPLAVDNMTVTVNPTATCRFSVASALGGDYVNLQTSLEQMRLMGGTLDLNHAGFNYFHVGLVGTEGRLVMQGGTVTGGGQIEPAGVAALTPTTFTVLPSENSSVIAGSGAIALNPGNSFLNLDVADGAAEADLIISRTISGGRPLTKLGAGKLVLTGVNSFSGTFTVSTGTVDLENSSTGTSATSFAAGTTLEGNGSMGSLTTDGVVKVDIQGDYSDQFKLSGNLVLGATSSLQITGDLTEPLYQIIKHDGTRTGTFGTVTGVPSGYSLVYNSKNIVLVSDTAEAYWTWASDLSNPDPEADLDFDGMPNILEFVLNSNATASSVSDLPDVSTNPAGDLVFTFVRNSSSAYLGAVVEYSTSLADESWTPFAGTTVQENTPGAGLDTVTATLPASLAGPGQKLFARLKVEVP
jgi:autotransporter-associated beta strand protein